MSEDTEKPIDTRLQVLRFIDSMRAAGLDWVPISAKLSVEQPPAPKPVVVAPSAVVTPQPLPVVQTGLFTPTAIVEEGSIEDRLQRLEGLRQQVSKCTRCSELASSRSKTVFGVGPIDPDLCFVGEAPGRDEDFQGLPFVGAAGQLLTAIINACGMQREEVFICNILRCRPPGNRTPNADEAENCKEWLEATLELVRPKYICTLGATPLRYLLGVTLGITKARGKFYNYRGIPVLATFHPSYLLRDPTKKREAWEDMKTLLAKMGKPVPGKG